MDCLGTCFTHAQTQCNSCSKCYAMDCFGTFFTHAQTCDVECFSSVYVESRSIIWRSNATLCVVVHISRTSYKNRKTSDCVVNHMILDYANVWRHRASRRRVTLFVPTAPLATPLVLWFFVIPWHGVRWGGDVNILWTCTHLGCYATVFFLCT